MLRWGWRSQARLAAAAAGGVRRGTRLTGRGAGVRQAKPKEDIIIVIDPDCMFIRHPSPDSAISPSPPFAADL